MLELSMGNARRLADAITRRALERAVESGALARAAIETLQPDGRFGRPGPYQSQSEDAVQHAGKSEIQYSSGLAGDGETRTRTGDTFMARAEIALTAPKLLQFLAFP